MTAIWLLRGRWGRDADLDARLVLLAQSGPLIAEATTGGRVGWVNLAFQVAVYPGGLVVNGIGYGMRVILASEIRRVGWEGPWPLGGVSIEHDGVACGSPVSIRTRRNSQLATAIFQIAEGKAA